MAINAVVLPFFRGIMQKRPAMMDAAENGNSFITIVFVCIKEGDAVLTFGKAQKEGINVARIRFPCRAVVKLNYPSIAISGKFDTRFFAHWSTRRANSKLKTSILKARRKDPF